MELNDEFPSPNLSKLYGALISSLFDTTYLVFDPYLIWPTRAAISLRCLLFLRLTYTS